MSTCRICGNVMGMPGDRYACAKCYPLFEQEVSKQKFPPGLTERAKCDFTYEQWVKFKVIERRLQSGLISMEDAVAKMQKLVQYLNDAPMLRAEAAQKREAFRRLQLY